jgi:hypothetical protein
MTFDELISHTFSQIQCLSCSNPQRDFCLAQLAGFFLACEAGGQPKLSRDQLMRRCCKHTHAADGVTLLVPEYTGKIPELQEQPPARAWWR